MSYSVHVHTYNADADRIGMQAAQHLGVPAATVLKTLMAQVDGRAVCVIVPSDREVTMKRLATACRGNLATMMRPADAERITGDRVGGISPFGQLKQVPVVLGSSVLEHDAVLMIGGQRTLQVRLDPNDARAILKAQAAAVVAES